MTKTVKLLYALLVISTLAMTVAVFSVMTSLITESQRIEISSRDNLPSITSQSYHELILVIETLRDIESGVENVDKQTLLDRVDILWSRHLTNTSGAAGRAYLALPGGKEAMGDLLTLLNDSDKTILDLDIADRHTARLLVDSFRELAPKLYRISLETNKLTSEMSASLHDQVQRVGFWAQIFFPGILLTSLIVGAILWRERRALGQLAKTLEARVEERTLDLQRINRALKQEMQERASVEASLRHAQKMKLVGQLTGGVAHDFNNLLAIIQGNADLLSDDLDDSLRPFAEAIIRASGRGSELVQRMLSFARQQPLQPKITDVAELIGGMSDMINRTIGGNISVHYQYGADLWKARVDQGQIENALLNLIINSRHAMHLGGELNISCENKDIDTGMKGDHPSGDYIAITVADTGIGISEEDRERVFEPFYTTKDIGEGTGLGLAMVYGFVEQSGGFVDLQSESGKGTSISLYLPRSDGQTPTQEAQQHSKIAKGNGETVLILEDDLEVRKMTEGLVLSLNYKTKVAASIQQAREILDGPTPIDLILSDVILPGGMTGTEFGEMLKKEDPHIKIIFMSGYAADISTGQSLVRPGQLLLSKPVSRKTLANALSAILNSE